MHIHTIEGYIQTIYLAEYPDKLLLLDGASRADITYLCQFIEQQLARPLSDLKVVVVTHMHPDHAGAAHRLRAITGCQIVSADKKTHWYQGWSGGAMFLSDLLLALWVAGRMKKARVNLWYDRYLKPDSVVNEGDQIPGFPDWTILETPGHTDRDLSLWHEPTRLLYVADLMVEVKQHLISPFPIFYPNHYRRSVERVFKLNPETLLVAHGGSVTFDERAYQHLIVTIPTTPSTHWRATKTKLRAVLKGLFAQVTMKRKQ